MIESKVCIIGAGFAGLYCQLFLQRAGIQNILITGMSIGGQIMYTQHIANYFAADGYTGEKLIAECRETLAKYNSRYLIDNVRSIERIDGEYRFKVDTFKNSILCDYIVLCTGARAKHLNIKNEDKLLYKTIFTCASCEADILSNNQIAVIGGGENAVYTALYCAKICSKVHVIVRKDRFKFKGKALETLYAKDNIDIHKNATLHEIDDDLNFIFQSEDKIIDIKPKYVLLSIGHKPNTDAIKFLNCHLECTEEGYIKVDATNQSSIENIYAAGENMDPDYQQLVTSGAQGVIAAMNIIKTV